MAKKKLNIAMIGYAFMGRAHSNGWRQAKHFMGPDVEPVLKVICGRSEDKVKAAAESLGWEEHATRWQDVIARDDIDIVDVATPGDSHSEISIAAARAGKHVLCEKPLANTVAECHAMIDAVKKAGVVHMICHNYRRAPAVSLAKRLIDEGKLGRIFHYRGTYLQDWLVNPDVPRYWRMVKSEAGSGALGDILSHTLDLSHYLVGDVKEVCATMETFIKERTIPGTNQKGPVDVDDAAMAMVRFDNGALGFLEGTRYANGRKNYNRFEINGSKGSIAFNLERMNELEVYEDNGPDSGWKNIMVTDPKHPYADRWWPAGHIIGYEHTFTHTFFDFLNAIAGGKAVIPNFEDGLKNQIVLEAIEKSANERSWVSIK